MSVIVEKKSLSEYLERALYAKAQGPAAEKGQRQSRTSGREEWFGTASWQETVDLVERGWPQGRDLMGQILANVEAQTQNEIVKDAFVWDVTGDFVDVGAYCSGEPECMVRTQRKRLAKVRVARLCANLSASGGVSAEVLRWRGACILALVDKLQASGIRAEVDIALCQKKNENAIIRLVTVKRAEEPLHLDTLAFHLSNPSSLRRIFFSYA